MSEMQLIFNEILKSVWPNLANVFWSLTELNKNLQYYTKIYSITKNLQYYKKNYSITQKFMKVTKI